MKQFVPGKTFVLLLALAIGGRALAGEATNAVAPVTARDFYNAGTRLLAAKKYDAAGQMFESALAGQDERVQPPALYNLGHARFDEGVELLKKGPDAQRTNARSDTALAAGGTAIHSMESALTETNVEKMVAAYLEGRGARRELTAAQKAVQAAMEICGKTLTKWQGAADDFKSAAELNPADLNAARNARLVERDIARLVDSLQAMRQAAGGINGQKRQLGQLLGKLKGRIPAADAPPGAAGDTDEDEDGLKPDALAGQKENASREGNQMQIPLSPDQAGQILDGLSLNGTRPLGMSDKEGKPPGDRKGRNW